MTDTLLKHEWVVRSVSMSEALDVVRRNHYAGGASKTYVALHGLFRADQKTPCQGVAWWLPPTRAAAVSVCPENPNGVLSLSRLAIDPDVPRNGASFLLARARNLLDRDRWPVLVTYADTWQGHLGGIYRADNWVYVGETPAYNVYTKDGRSVSRKRGKVTLNHKQMLAEGAVCEGRFSKHKFIHEDRRKARASFV